MTLSQLSPCRGPQAASGLARSRAAWLCFLGVAPSVLAPQRSWRLSESSRSLGRNNDFFSREMGCKSTKPQRPVVPPPPPCVLYKCPGCSKMVETETNDTSKCARGGYATFTASENVQKDANLESIVTCEFCGQQRDKHFGSYGDCIPDVDMFWPYAIRCCECLLREKIISQSAFSKKACKFCSVLQS
jgi:hypothetical protein